MAASKTILADRAGKLRRILCPANRGAKIESGAERAAVGEDQSDSLLPFNRSDQEVP